MQFTPEHEELRRSLQTFIDREINPHVDEWEEAGSSPPTRCSRRWAMLGLLGLTKPAEYGGTGLDYSYAMVMAEELGHINCGGVPDGDRRADRHGDAGARPLRQRRAASANSWRRRSPATTSPASASPKPAPAPTSPRSRPRARKVGGDYVINGGKMWTTNGTQADWMCLLANTVARARCTRTSR